jgi:glycosyltransferase involved in cell wall biosynthesis
MNVLFLTLSEINAIQDRGIYQDLLRKFVSEGHHVTIVSPAERRRKMVTNLQVKNNVNILQVKTLNIQKTNIIEKGIGTLAIEYQYLNAIKKHLSHIKFDLVLYSTPPITFYKVIHFIKKRDNAYAYLLLKDIFPQNAVDMKMMKSGSILHKLFVKKEKKLYKISDTIGCMSPANVNFILKHNVELNDSKVVENPNSIQPRFIYYSDDDKNAIRKKYNLPLNKKIFVYGGNIGKPQGLDFLLETITKMDNPNVYYLIVGSGTEYNRIDKWFKDNNPINATILAGLPKQDYDVLLSACDVGLIFLHKDFTIPNFPSRLLSYLEMKIPVIAATDFNTDIGNIVEEYNCGYKVISGDSQKMQEVINDLCSDEEKMKQLGENGFKLLEKKYDVSISYNLIKNKILNV